MTKQALVDSKEARIAELESHLEAANGRTKEAEHIERLQIERAGKVEDELTTLREQRDKLLNATNKLVVGSGPRVDALALLELKHLAKEIRGE